MHKVFLEGEAPRKSLGTLFFGRISKTICLYYRKQSIWVAGSSIRAVQSLQLQQIGQLET